ncbi:MAG: hypothetical protein JNJ41_12075 [Bacteroidia bacterium]|nr:hypothetical protein [Bacteroidia bacterium]
MKNKLFISEFLHDRKIGAVAPTSKYLANEIIKKINFKNAHTITEYGPGDGIITKLILENMSQDAKLFVFETNLNFIEKLIYINDSRLIVIKEDAENTMEILKYKYNIEEVDCIISTIPFSLIKKDKRIKIINDSFKLLKKDGQFITYQYSWLILNLIKQNFKYVKWGFVVLNFLPVVLINCIKSEKSSI